MSGTKDVVTGRKVGFWGLRNKVLVPAILITALTGALLTWQATSQAKAIVFEDQQAQGMILCNFLVFDAGQNVLGKKEAAARMFLESFKNDHGLPYVYVLGENGDIYAHTFEGEIPAEIQKLVDSQKGSSGLLRKPVHMGGKDLVDIGAPILDAPGSVHVGMDLTRANQQVGRITRNAFLTVLALLAAGGVLLWVVMSRMVVPIQALSLAARRIVEEGDLTQKIAIASRDETGQMADYFNRMVEWQKSIQMDLTTTVLTLNETVRELESVSEAQNQAVTIQATALQETQVTAQEIKQTSQMASQKAEEILKMAKKAEEIGHTGETSVEQSLTGLMDIRSQVQEIAMKIADLTDRTRQIGSITDTVKDLADQSNMLALNAAIEAVRSGEHGKGFGLVAREIRRLADQSIQATGRVKEILDNISDGIEKVVQITESGSKRMEGGYSLVKASGDNLKALAGVVKENSVSVKQIATAVEQQNIGISQIFGAVTDQTQMMSESVKHVETTAETVKVLKGASERLSEVIRKFKT